ncbi:hypothetical protein BKA70DRAFT_1475132 [Coprinopsis sp. MPI-PUGE-AT-0042]|nr:hypothetical protein BKA70DRAFT_1475132 [Coprinopsis sp. MPI-PUGE-AT-0042]
MTLLEDVPRQALLAALSNPTVISSITFGQLSRFWKFSCAIRREIDLSTASTLAPHRLPVYIHDFLRESVGPIMFYPPSKFCKICKSRLTNLSRYPVAYFSTASGAYGGYSSSLSCDGCKIRYYPNYYAYAGIRHFYEDDWIPRIIQFEEHAFIDTSLCELFTSKMVYAWVSSGNCANIYNSSMADGPRKLCHPDSWCPEQFRLSTEQVWHAFYMNALLRDAADRAEPLVMLNVRTHEDRLKAAMVARNTRIAQYGQPERMHACRKCEVIDPKTNQPLRGVVTDGITLGRPCCTVHNCPEALIQQRARFCKTHRNRAKVCVFPDCGQSVVAGRKTCKDAQHTAWEDAYNEKRKAFFQLSKLLERSKVAHLPDSANLDQELLDQMVDVDSSEEPAHKSDSGNKNLKIQLARRRTHNEQLIVCCCGVIAARSTMFGAEAISGVKDFIKSAYLFDRSQLPDVIFYDNNCSLQAHLHASGDDFFRNVIMPVDVFHFKVKHKITDLFCQQHCNPAQWEQLVDEEGNWKLNSSAAEQANVWLGGYLAIVREMLPHRFDFFLDEMIKRRNEKIIQELHRTGQAPYIVPI